MNRVPIIFILTIFTGAWSSSSLAESICQKFISTSGESFENLRSMPNIKQQAAELCCQGHQECEEAFRKIEVSVSGPSSQRAGSFDVSTQNYQDIFTGLQKKSLGAFPISGKIILGSFDSHEQILRHEFGHACVFIRMQIAAKLEKDFQRKDHALRWLQSVNRRCEPEIKTSRAYADFWGSIGESPQLAQCLKRLVQKNFKEKANEICPGHYFEESVGIAFSFLTGTAEATRLQLEMTCSHPQDQEHPMVADVVDCLGRFSRRFQERLTEIHLLRSAKSLLGSGNPSYSLN